MKSTTVHWTPEQEAAIKARGGSIIVSAAAGSGKTAVLSERIVRMLISETDPVEPEELLVVTFTRAAAAEMRRRISTKLTEYIAEHRNRTDLNEVRSRLPDADICTIDSFCIKLVKENYREAGVSSDFDLLDESEIKVLKTLAMEDALGELSANRPDEYRILTSLDSSFDDNPLQNKVNDLYAHAQARPWSEKWLTDITSMYTEHTGTSVWQNEIRTYIRLCFDYCLKLINAATEELCIDHEMFAVYEENVNSDLNALIRILSSCDKEWDDLYDTLNSFTQIKLITSRKYANEPAKIKYHNARKTVKALIDEINNDLMTATDDEHKEDMLAITPVITALGELTLDFGKRLRILMDERGRYDFSTVLHLALNVLSTPDGKRTAAAERLSSQYREILIDEYQDTNAAQDILFSLISRNGANLFRVGDIKQSIYRFRMAMPEIFLAKLNAYTQYDEVTYPAKIILGKNFRSRKGVLDFANHVFGKLMSGYAGEIDYKSEDMLCYGEGYDTDESPAAEIHLLENDQGKDERTVSEAYYTAQLINRMISDGVTVGSGDDKRPCHQGDFCILFRSDGGNGEIWNNALKSFGLTCAYERSASLFDTPEIQILLSLLKIINNPSDDVAMLAVLSSPVFGLTPDELAELRLLSPEKTLFGALNDAADSVDHRLCAKASELVDSLKSLRHLNSINTLDTFVRMLVNETDLVTLVSAGENPVTRQANIEIVTEMASRFASSGGGLSGFIRFIDGAIRADAIVPAASDASSSSDAVKLMTIHRSKGLEFPFVIITDTNHDFNLKDLRRNMIIDPRTGIGLKRTEQEKLKRYPILSYSASSIAFRRAMISEELRILYVGITRARERIIITGTVKDIEKTFNNYDTLLPKPSPIQILHAKSQLDLLLNALGGHIRPETGTQNVKLDTTSIKFSATQITIKNDLNGESLEPPLPDPVLYRKISHKAGYKYPYIYPEGVRPKAKASEFENKEFSDAYFAVSRPGFMSPDGMSASEIGTANHAFLERCDLFADDAAAERDRLLIAGKISDRYAKALRIQELNGFLKSDIAKRLRASDTVIREKEFRAQLPIGMFFPEAENNVKDDTILIIGKADLVFIEDGQAVIVDYKTDRYKTDEEFIVSYGGQLRAYAAAMEQALGVPVKETLIFALDGAREIRC